MVVKNRVTQELLEVHEGQATYFKALNKPNNLRKSHIPAWCRYLLEFTERYQIVFSGKAPFLKFKTGDLVLVYLGL